MQIYDKNLIKLHEQRAKKLCGSNDDFLIAHANDDLNERLLDIKREFKNSIDIDHYNELLNLQNDKYDLIKSILKLHWVNDIVGWLIQAKNALKPDGLLLANFISGNSLNGLKQIFTDTEQQLHGGISPRFSPVLDVKTMGILLQRAGFALPVVDSDIIEVEYKNIYHLITHLRKTGLTNKLLERNKSYAGKGFFKVIDSKFTGIATYELITITAWKPDDSQQKPLPRGSGKTDLGNIL